MATKLVSAFVLVDEPAHGLKAGQIVEADAATVKALVASGAVDPHKEAVAAAQERGCPRVRSAIELAAERRAAEGDALRVEIAKLEDLVAKASDDTARAALETKLNEVHEQLVALG